MSWLLVVVALLVVVTVVIVAYSTSQSGSTSKYPFPCLANESLFFHVHPWLRIVINGQNVTIPQYVGVENPNGPNTCFEPMHTHDASGIIHIESPTNTNYTLGDFFKIWNATYQTITLNGVQHPIVFNQTDILGYKADATHRVVLLVNGNPSTAYGALSLVPLDYCNTQHANVPPCYPTAGGNPSYGTGVYPYPTGNTIVVEYTSSS
jgi:hypothetical protein